ncbi:LysM peptidoglycan-binding domain-containing protein [Desulfosarcina ovata]|uniref:LysM domain-containing protein n=1 Tax=Desulfosarcina ovata subsp. ovata TaxID=2752305 RepID=A0A5K8A3R2_9BACT|nr:LysM peptidoglycan-binding domain-containing protein [Desulfosarcina ovata]BBO86984.1 hypothetical protein DSCOOX_01640 [Desulfosarcina ovata subsp. ovata]
MKWKDTGGAESPAPEPKDPYYEDDGYPSFKEKGLKTSGILSANPVHYLYWGLGIALVIGVVLLVILLFSYGGDPVGADRIAELEQRIEQLEQQLQKVEGVDEKVTRIWEQAKAFETFKTRFDRSEASTSLRMDHLAMSLDALQKKTDTVAQKVSRLEKAPSPRTNTASPPVVKKTAAVKTHIVTAGDTLYSVSRKYHLSVEQLRSINNLNKEDVIHVGQTLTVSVPGD